MFYKWDPWNVCLHCFRWSLLHCKKYICLFKYITLFNMSVNLYLLGKKMCFKMQRFCKWKHCSIFFCFFYQNQSGDSYEAISHSHRLPAAAEISTVQGVFQKHCELSLSQRPSVASRSVIICVQPTSTSIVLQCDKWEFTSKASACCT